MSRPALTLFAGLLFTCWLLPLLHPVVCAGQAAPPQVPAGAPVLRLVEDGKARSAVIVRQPENRDVMAIADYFIAIIERSSGARIPVVSAAEAELLPADTVRIVIDGRSPSAADAAAAGGTTGSTAEGEQETYRIVAAGNTIQIQGKAARAMRDPLRAQSNPLRWAVNALLEESVGVRWLWPGELGTYVPKRADVAVASQEVRYQPELLVRSLRLFLRGYQKEAGGTLVREAVDWAENHQAGMRGGIPMGHAFTQWWDKYGAEHPDYFAQTPAGVSQPFLGAGGASYVKLRLANPAVIDRIEQEYRAAGAPDYWNVSPNDRYGFDISDETREWDIPQGLDPRKIWSGEANLTPRYVEFWNRIYDRLKTINPNVRLSTYAYYAYYKPPPAERPLRARAIVGIVGSYNDYKLWQGWEQAGVEMILRPNWWHLGADAPHIPNRAVYDYLKFASENGMVGLSMDSVLGHWATQGINYYIVARMMSRPQSGYEAIMTEYLEAFGAGAPFIRELFDHFEALTEAYRYDSPQGRLAQLVAEGRIANRWAKGSHQALPLLWLEQTLAPAYALLAQAAAAIGDDDPEQTARVGFLRRGLDHLRLKREVIVLSEKAAANPSAKNLEAFAAAMGELDRLRAALSADHVVWQKSADFLEDGHRVFVRRKNEAALLLPEEM